MFILWNKKSFLPSFYQEKAAGYLERNEEKDQFKLKIVEDILLRVFYIHFLSCTRLITRFKLFDP